MQHDLSQPTHSTDNRPVHVLLVDDSLVDLTLLSDMLSEQDYRVQRTSSATAALRIVETLLPDIIMLDINMPEMNGYDLCQKLKAHSKAADVPIIFVSASDNGIDKQKAFNVGGADYIEKPFQPEELNVRIQNQLKIRWSAIALQEKNHDLEATVKQLRHTQSLVIEAERVSTLSQIVGNIAQEIQIPMRLVSGNLQHMQRCCDNILSLLHLYGELCKRPEFLLSEAQRDSQLSLIQSDIKDITQLLTLTLTEAGQVSTVTDAVQNLFKRDESILKMIDINKSIDIVLSILQRRFEPGGGPSTQLIRNLGLLPRVACFPNQLGQALFVMFNQALDAIYEKFQPGGKAKTTPTIEVSTQLQHQDKITITIRHNGMQPPELAYLRTKPPQWTIWNSDQPLDIIAHERELNLFISYQIIVDKHQGQFDYRVTEDGMTECLIELPVLQPAPVLA